MSHAGFRIREFRRGDFNALWEIDQKCFPQGIAYSQMELLTYMRRLRSFTLVAERAEGSLGESGLRSGLSSRRRDDRRRGTSSRLTFWRRRDGVDWDRGFWRRRKKD